MSADALAEKAEADRKSGGRAPQTILGIPATFNARLDLSVPTHFASNTRVPVVVNEEQPASRISYVDAGSKVTISGAWSNNVANVHLKGEFCSIGLRGPSTQPSRLKPGVKTDTMEQTVQAPDGRPTRFKFQEQPLPLGDDHRDWGRIYVGTLTMRQLAGSGNQASRMDGSAAQPATVLVEVFILSADREKLVETDLNAKVATAATGAEILKYLSAYGPAYQTGNLQTTLDLASEQRLLSGARVPTVQDVNISAKGVVTPSITYEETGNKLDLMPTRWMQVKGRWICDLQAKLSVSFVGESSVAMHGDVRLPVFGVAQFSGQRRFESGRPVNSVVCGASGDRGKVSVCVVHMVLTRPK